VIRPSASRAPARRGVPPWSRVRGNWHLERSLLPNPGEYYREIAKIKLTGGAEWKSGLCPFHRDTKPSLRVHLERGAYRCMVCGARGGDIIAFHSQWRGLDFIATCKALGAWKEGAR